MENMLDTRRKIKSKFGFIESKFYDVFDLVFIFDKKTNPRYGLAKKIPDENLYILDVCSGTGNSSIIIAKKTHKNKIFAIDFSSAMLTVAKKKIQKNNIENIFIQQMDATQMAFQDNSFDITTISFGLHELSYDLMIKVLKEMFRVLKSGGKIYIIDYEKQDSLIKNALLSIFLKIFEPPHMLQFLQYNWENILKDIGFSDIQIEKYLFSKLISANKL
jgi:demethylmenaquinone methyltransferase/2-methoxy-6-polyprenyl-1,4-benzoquinol methylase